MNNYLTADGFDEAIVGICTESQRVVYDKQKMINVLVERDGMDEIDAIEYLEFNTWGAYVGVHTPIYLDPFSTLENLDEV